MEEEDNDEFPVDIRASVKRFEESVNSNQPVFFDVITFEYIVNHYEAIEQWKKAFQVLDYALEQYPYSSLFMVKKAGLLIYYRKYKLALELLDQAETLDPGDISVQILRSDVYLEKNQHYRAERILK